jgi:predicted PurR-regulated permease PerM
MNRSLDAVILRYVGYALLFGAAIFLVYMVRGALPIFCVAGLLAYAMEPVLKWLERRGHSRPSAVAYVFVVFLLLFALMIALLATAWQQVQALATQAPQYQKQFTQVVEVARDRIDELRLPENIKKSIAEAVDDFQQRVPGLVGTKIKDAVTWILSSIGLLLLILVILPIITLWLMLEMNPLRARVLMLIPPQYRRDVIKISGDINEMLGRYLRGQMIVCSLFGVLCTITFYVLHLLYGMEYPLVLGMAAAFLYIVPYIGMASLATAAGLTAYFTSSAPVACAAIAVGCCFAFNLVIDYGVTPRVIGKGVGLHPLMVIFALLCGAQLGGIFGMILAIPFFASLRVVAIHLFPQLIAPIPQNPPETDDAKTAPQSQKIEEIARQTSDAEQLVSVRAPD